MSLSTRVITVMTFGELSWQTWKEYAKLGLTPYLSPSATPPFSLCFLSALCLFPLTFWSSTSFWLVAFLVGVVVVFAAKKGRPVVVFVVGPLNVRWHQVVGGHKIGWRRSYQKNHLFLEAIAWKSENGISFQGLPLAFNENYRYKLVSL